ncbi:MAG: ABC transporter permease, partial [Flavobacteriaceae bacterium]|nr:ABC transporter permease [Flavobacteriaceae bacterium]
LKYVDTGFFKIFSFPFTEGSSEDALNEKYSVVISKKVAEKYFGKAPALGKQLDANFGKQHLTVKGVVAIPENSSVKFDILASYATGEEILPWMKDVHDWYNTFSETWIVLKKGIQPPAIQVKLQGIVKENFLPHGENTTHLNLLALKAFHSKEESNQVFIVILGIIALGIIGIAMVNSINLTITNSLSRIKEIGIKKIHGATGKSLFNQIMAESFLSSTMAMIAGILTAQLLLPVFNRVFEANLHLSTLWQTPLLIVIVLIWLLISLLSGIIPSLFWSGTKLTDSLQGKTFSLKRLGLSGHSSIVIQFVIAIVLISGTFLIRKQVRYMQGKDPKFDTKNVVVVPLDSWRFEDPQKASQHIKHFSEDVSSSPYVRSLSFSNTVPGQYDENYNTFFTEVEPVNSLGLRKAYVAADFFKTMGIRLTSGSGFSKELPETEKYVILNKKAMQELGFSEAMGQILHESAESGEAFKVIGAVDNFSYQGVQREVQPLAHFLVKNKNLADWNYLLVRANPGATLPMIQVLKDKWKADFPGMDIKYSFADEKLNAQYKQYLKINALIGWFSLLAIILSCMGLFAMATYAMARRTKEIGIRKVNGANTGQILLLLNKDFLKWVLLAFLIAVPVSWYGIYKWLQNFALKTEISWWVFLITGLLTFLIAFLTVNWQGLKTATLNPVESLRDE